MLENFYKVKIKRYKGQGEYNFSDDEIVQAIKKTIEFNNHKDMTLFIYNCQNTDITNVVDATSHSGDFL